MKIALYRELSEDGFRFNFTESTQVDFFGKELISEVNKDGIYKTVFMYPKECSVWYKWYGQVECESLRPCLCYTVVVATGKKHLRWYDGTHPTLEIKRALFLANPSWTDERASV